MREIWRIIEYVLHKKAESVLNALKNSATYSEIDFLEKHLRFTIDEDFKEYLSIHNGQHDYHHLVHPWSLYDIDYIVESVDMMRELFGEFEQDDGFDAYGPVKPTFWNAKWVPFAGDGIGNQICLDFDPDVGGEVGQVILWAADPPYVEVIAPSIRAWFKQFLDDLLDNKFIWDSANQEWRRK